MSEIEYRPIDIDFEVYQLIVLEKRGFDESDNEALRRLLGWDNVPSNLEFNPPLKRAPWSGNDIVLPEGTKLQMTYRGVEHNGVVVGRKWEVEGKCYNTPSQAAAGVARTKHGEKTNLNGWKYWFVKRPGDTGWIAIDDLRKGKVR